MEAALLTLALLLAACSPHRDLPITAVPADAGAVCFVRAYSSGSSTSAWPVFEDGARIARLRNNRWACVEAVPGTYRFGTAAIATTTGSMYQSGSGFGRPGGQVNTRGDKQVFDERETEVPPGEVVVLSLTFGDGQLYLGPGDPDHLRDPRLKPIKRVMLDLDRLRP